ncbi:MAG: glycosyltransferase [Acidimicrobiales bacterium]
MRVLHLTSSFPRWPEDPVAPFLLDLARAQAAAGIEVHVLAPHDAGLPRVERWGGVSVHRFFYAPAPLERLAYRGGMLSAATGSRAGAALVPGLAGSFTAAAVAAARRLAPDVIHAHWWFPAGAAGVLAGAATHTPCVITLHGSDVHLMGRPGWALAARAVLGRAAAVVGVSAALAAEAARAWGVPVARVGVARMPVAVPAPGLLATPFPPHPPILLVFVGRLVPEKGLDVLLKAIDRAFRGDLDLHLNVIGEGPQKAELQRLAAPLGERVSWAGVLPRAEVGRALVAAHCLVVPSRREGLGLVALEALAHGRPVIVSRVGGLAEVVADGVDGILVAPGDEVALAGALMRLPLGPPTGEMVGAHRPEAVASDHLALYASVL